VLIAAHAHVEGNKKPCLTLPSDEVKFSIRSTNAFKQSVAKTDHTVSGFKLNKSK